MLHVASMNRLGIGCDGGGGHLGGHPERAPRYHL